ncbi:acyltransferase [Erythrobacter sp. SCSIO 43205]|uniref:acyltransferase family protein n=1 Tax=Erythrobacter sp. SCSIO 43205 TaxID=2779361 RepID=UPI001CA951B3|nr:acyltransferase [Erythrobacter sp. SCSIO 43205]UAB78162.1 acyltransferase [Erythrobacter sp. SCSIO 43205]
MQTIKGFDGLRAISVIFVILTHLGVYTVAKSHGVLSDNAAPIVSGTTGVQVFFVLSGFLITSLLIKEHEASGTISLKGFYIRRAFRILPLYVLCLALTLVIDLFVWDVASAPSLIYAALFNTSFIPREDYSQILGHTWSLSVEEHFYVLWPAALLFAYRFNYARALLHLGVGIVITLILYAATIRLEEINDAYFVGRWSVFAGAWIAFGCIAAIVINGPYRRANVFLASRAALLIGAALFFHSLVLGIVPKPLDELLRVMGVVLIVCWIVRNQASALVKALEYEPLAYTGKISYGLYMWQGLMLSTGPERAAGQVWPLNPGLGLLLLCVVAPLSYHFFEKRFLALSARYRHTALHHKVEERAASAAPLKS